MERSNIYLDASQVIRRNAERLPDGLVLAKGKVPALLAQRAAIEAEHAAAAAEAAKLKALVDELPARRAAIEAEIRQAESERAGVAGGVLLGEQPAKADDDLHFKLAKLHRELERIDLGGPSLEATYRSRVASVAHVAWKVADVNDQLAAEMLDQKILIATAEAAR